jgi:hypothetical protein
MADPDERFHSGQPVRWTPPRASNSEDSSETSTQRFNNPVQLPRYGRMPLNWRARDADRGYNINSKKLHMDYESSPSPSPSPSPFPPDLRGTASALQQQQQPSAAPEIANGSPPISIETSPVESYAGPIVFASMVLFCFNILFGAVALALAGNLHNALKHAYLSKSI